MGSTVISSRAVVMRAPPVGSVTGPLPTASSGETRVYTERRPATSAQVAGRPVHPYAVRYRRLAAFSSVTGSWAWPAAAWPGVWPAAWLGAWPWAWPAPWPWAWPRGLVRGLVHGVRGVLTTDGQVAPLGHRDGRDRDDDGHRGDAVAQRRAGARADGERDDRRGDEHRDEVHDLEQRVDRRAGGVLERVTDGVADDRRLVRLGALAAVARRPRRSSSRCPTTRRSWRGTRPSATPVPIAPARKPASGPMPRPKPTATGISAASRPGVASSRSESLVQMSTTRPYSGFSV